MDNTLGGQATGALLDLLEFLWSLVVRLWCNIFLSLGRLGVLGHRWCNLGLAAAMQSTSELGDGLVEVLSLDLSELKLLGRGLTGTVSTSEGAGTPGAATADLGEISQGAESLGVTEGNVDDAVVGEGRDGVLSSGLLTTTLGSGRDEDTGHLAPETTGSPLLAGLVPESLPLGGEVSVTGGDTKEEGIVALKDGGVVESRDVGGLGRSVHLGENLLGEGLGDLEEVGGTASLFNAGLLSLGQLLDVAVHGVLEKMLVTDLWWSWLMVVMADGDLCKWNTSNRALRCMAKSNVSQE